MYVSNEFGIYAIKSKYLLYSPPKLFSNQKQQFKVIKAKMIRKRYRGPLFLAGSIVFTTATISAVMWDLERQRIKRQANIRYRLQHQHTPEQYQNLTEYMEQKQKFEEYKRAATQNSS